MSEASEEITIYNRTPARAAELAEAFNCRCAPWETRERIEADLLVNCTGLGMWPDIEDSPLTAAALSPGTIVFDTVYNPLRTRLLQDAAERGCGTIDGLTMFALQAQAQSRLWTGRSVPEVIFRSAAESEIRQS